MSVFRPPRNGRGIAHPHPTPNATFWLAAGWLAGWLAGLGWAGLAEERLGHGTRKNIDKSLDGLTFV
jgi:hypothetical protein